MPLKKNLLVEDDSDDQLLFTTAIDSLPLSIYCKTVNNGREALDHLNKIFDYDLIFLYLNMPVMDGIDCLDLLKRHEKYRDLPVIMFTTSFNPADIEKCKTLGVQSYFQKPSTFSELCYGLQSLLTA